MYIFDREHTMRKRSYNLVCCCLDPLTLLSKEVNLLFERNLDECPFSSKIEGDGLRYSCCPVTWRPCCPGGLAALAALLPWQPCCCIQKVSKVFKCLHAKRLKTFLEYFEKLSKSKC